MTATLRTYEFDATLRVKLTVPATVVDRCVENHDDEGTPVPTKEAGGPGTGWRDLLYDLATPEDVLRHLVAGLIIRRKEITALDGWADLDPAVAALVQWKVDEVYVDTFGMVSTTDAVAPHATVEP